MITVFTPSFNKAEYLKRVYDSLLAQTSRDFERILIDDGSPDNTDRIADAILNDIGRFFEFTYLKQKHGGKHRAVNLAVKHAKGEFLLILDSDDRLVKHAVELLECVKEQQKKVAGGIIQQKWHGISGNIFRFR